MIVASDEPEVGMASLTEREQQQIDQANTSGRTPVVFIHGLWLHASSWATVAWAVTALGTAAARLLAKAITGIWAVSEAAFS